MKNVHSLLEKGFGWHSNCWGTTQWTLECQDGEVPEFIEADQMNNWLKRATVPVDGEPKPGDILVVRNPMGNGGAWRGSDWLVHTAVYMGAAQWWHQAGAGGPFAMDTQEGVLKIYGHKGYTTEYRRLASFICDANRFAF